MIPTLAFTGSATEYASGNGDLSSIVAVDSAQADVRFKNISDSLQKIWYRKTGTTGTGESVDLSPLESSGNISIDLTSARTMEYYIEGGGSIECRVVNYGGVLASTGSLTYSSTDAAHKLNHGDMWKNTNSGVTDAMTLEACRQVKARIKAAGLTPPDSDDTLAVAENFYVRASMVWKERVMGSLASGGGGTSSQDNVNKSYKMFMDLGNEQVDNYIASVANTLTQPYDTAGVIRTDVIGGNFKLHQRTIGKFTEA